MNHRCARIKRHFVGLPIDFLQSLSLHPQFHLRVAFADLSVPLAEQLCHPLIGAASQQTQTCKSSSWRAQNGKITSQLPPKSISNVTHTAPRSSRSNLLS